MKLQLKPQIHSVSKRVGPAATCAGLSKDGHVRWVYENAYLEVSCPATNGILASWRFGKELQDKETCVTAVTDVYTQAGLLLIVATSNISDCGTLHVFSVKLRRVVHVIEIPNRISALEVIFENETEDVSPWIISKHLQFFSGLLAVGTDGGFIYLVDLCLDEMDMSIASEATPKKLMIITPRIVDPLQKKEQARTYDKHLALMLDDQCHKQEQFYYRRQDDTVQKVFEEDAVWVSSLKYMAQAGTLAIGFNFGCFQLWRLYNPVLDYSSRYNPDNTVVTHFLSQEAENDPRNFVYLWVVYDNASEDSTSNICLYQLSFTKKDAYANFGIFYDELESVCPRLDHNLTVDPYSVQPSGTIRSTMINCYTLQNPLYTAPAILSDSFDDGFHGNDSSLSIFVWRADSTQGGRGSAASSYWLSIFDINRWYHAQMPHSMRCHGASLQVCSFWAVYDLDDVVSCLPSQALLNVEVNGKKVLRFINNTPVPPEEHSYPSALQLPDVCFVMADGAVQTQCHGWQKSLLREMVVNGAEYLVQPADFYHQCLRARLLPQSFEESKTRSTSYQRKMLLNMALEQGLAPALIPQCVRLWEEEGFVEQGCTLSLLLNWAWESVITLKTSFDKSCSLLYDWSGVHLDQRTDQQISQLSQALSHIRHIFNFFTIQAPPTTERGQFELELRQEVLNVLLQHCEVVRWSISSSLLPEIDEVSELSRGLFAFPASELGQAYKRRRAELSTMTGSIDGMSLLLIDSLVECQGPYIRQVWENLGGDGTYPPPSMQAMMNMYLIEEVSLEVKNAIMLYFLQNVAMLDPTPEREAAVASFIQRFMLSPSTVHQVQGLWFIDHSDFEEGVRHLVNANVHQDLCHGMRPAAVVNTLLAQGQGRLASCYMHSKPALGGSAQEQQLYISVLLDNRQVSQALEILRGCGEEKLGARLMEHLLKECQSNKLLGLLLQLNLNEWEESSLEAHLRGRPEAHALEPLLLYYLHRSRFLQAFRLNQEMNAQDKLVASLASQERSVTRNRLMDAYLKVLPEVTRRMLTEKQTAHAAATSARRIQVDQPKPLSTVVRQADFQGMSQAKFIMAVIDKVNEATHLLMEEEEEELESNTAKDGFEELLDFDMPFLQTPRTPQRTPSKRKSEAIFRGTEISPLAAPSPSQSARKMLSVIRAAESQEEKDSLKKLAEECLQVLQTPVRDHKRKSLSPGLSSLTPAMKTPQSILKVRRLSKTLPGSREKLSSRRHSGSRAMRLGTSKSDTSHNASHGPATPTTPPSASEKQTTITLASASATPKQLRFTGISPSPTPSPSMAHLSISLETEKSTEVEQDVTPAVSPPSAYQISSDSISQEIEKSEVEKEPLSPKGEEHDMEVVPMEDVGVSPNAYNVDDAIECVHADKLGQDDLPSFEEGPDDRYSDKLKVLVRPDLQSPWKQGSPDPGDAHMDVDVRLHKASDESPSSSSSPVLARIEERPDKSLVQQRLSSEQVSIMQTSEKLITSFSGDVLSSSSVYKEVLMESTTLDHKEPTKTVADLALFLAPLSPAPLSQRKSPSLSPKTPPKSTAPSLPPIEIETSPSPSASKLESPPATPPSSKRAKLMVSKGDDTAELLEVKIQRSRASPGEDRETRRRKTPERKAAALRKTIEESAVDISAVSDKMETRRTKTPERRSPGRQQKMSEESIRKTPERRSPSRKVKVQDTGLEELSIEKDLSDRIESRRTKTPERKSPARQLKLGEESARRSPSTKVRKPSDDRDTGLEEPSDGRDSSPVRTRAKTPERKSPSRILDKISQQETSMAAVDVCSTEATQDGERHIDRFGPAETFIENLQEPQPETSLEVPIRRRSTRLNTPDRSVVEVAGAKTFRGSKQRDTTPSRQDKESESSSKEEKFSSAEEVLNAVTEPDISQEVSVRRRSTRLNTPDRSVSETARARSATPTRVGKQQNKQGDKSPSKEDETVTVSRKSSRKNQTDKQLTDETEMTEEDPMQPLRKNKKSDESLAAENEKDPPSLRKSGRQSKTPDRFLSLDVETHRASTHKTKIQDQPAKEDESEPIQIRKSRRETKTPLKAIAEAEDSKASGLRRSKRQSKTPENVLEEDSDKDESVIERQEGHNLRRSKRQSKTPDRQAARSSVEPLTPTRRSRRQHKTPEVLNTDEIEPVPASSPSGSPKRRAREAFPEPATPPKMSSKKSESEKEQSTTVSPSRSARRSPGRKVLMTVEEDAEEFSQTTTRRSARKAKSPERLNTEQIQPVSPQDSPIRSKSLHFPSEVSAQLEDQTDKPLESDVISDKNMQDQSDIGEEQTATIRSVKDPVRSFLFSPPVTHLRRSKDSQPDTGTLTEVAPGTANQKHHFVFSNPSIASPPKEENKQPAKNKRPKKLRKLYNEDEVSLLSPIPTPVGRRKVPKRQVSGTQRAAALFLNRSKQTPTQRRRLVPSIKVSPKPK